MIILNGSLDKTLFVVMHKDVVLVRKRSSDSFIVWNRIGFDPVINDRPFYCRITGDTANELEKEFLELPAIKENVEI